jgi:hypothetical protein
MARLDVIIADDLENKFRIEIIKRYGGRKGDLSKAISEAIEVWMSINEVKLLTRTANNFDLSVSEREKAIKILGNCGKAAIPALNKIANNKKFGSKERELALAEIDTIMTDPKAYPVS